VTDGGAALLLRRRTEPVPESRVVLGHERVGAGQRVAIPASDGLGLAEIDMRLGPLGRLSKLAFRVPPVLVELVDASGRRRSLRITPDTARSGLLVNVLPASLDQMYDLFRGVASAPATGLVITGPGTPYYERDVGLTWIGVGGGLARRQREVPDGGGSVASGREDLT
jgi:hypothetical protein